MTTGTAAPAARRFFRYAVALGIAVIAGFFLGTSVFGALYCGAPEFDGECDVAGLSGVLWAVGALILGLVVIAVLEV